MRNAPASRVQALDVKLEVPETADLSRLRIVLEHLQNGVALERVPSLKSRQVGYVIQTLRCLGLVDATRSITPSGAAYLKVRESSKDEAELLRRSILASPLATVLPEILTKPDPVRFAKILETHPACGLSPSTAAKRASAIASWSAQLGGSATPRLARGQREEPKRVDERRQDGACRLLLVQLSDIHLTATVQDNPVMQRSTKIAEAVTARIELFNCKTCLLLVTGDITQAGLEEEFVTAREFLAAIAAEVTRRTSADVSVRVLPGNHDLDLSEQDSVRDVLLASDKLDAKILKRCVEPLKNFYAFASQMESDFLPVNPLASRWNLNCGPQQVEVVAYNSAWCSKRHEQEGTLSFPSSGLVEPSLNVALVITAFHHPYSWLRNEDGRGVREHVEKVSDIVLSGHEHVPGRYDKIHESGEHSEYVEGGVLQDRSEPDTSAFNILAIDFESKTQQTFVLAWSSSEKMYETRSTYKAREFRRNQHATRSQFFINADAHALLLDPGEPYKHPRKLDLKLADIFIDPLLKPSTPKTEERSVRATIDLVLENERVLICGAELSGKTAIAKRLFVGLHDAGIVPVLVDGRQLVDSSDDASEKAIASAFCSHFSVELLERWLQLDPRQRAVIIDDIHASPLSAEHKDRAVKSLERFGAHVVVMASAEFPLVLVDALRTGTSTLLEYQRFTIEELGARLRYELVEKWCFAGIRAIDDPAQFSRRAQQLDSIVTRAIGTNLLPSLPALVLLCLQQLDAQADVGHATMGSFGHLYESMVVKNLFASSVAGRPSIDLDGKRTFLAHVAYQLFEAKVDHFSEPDWGKSFDEYAERHDVAYPKQQFLEEIFLSGLVVKQAGDVRFRYRYAYYFFVGEYLAHHLSDSTVQSTVATLCGQLNHDDSANVVLFLSHLCRDPSILETLLGRAQFIFATAAVPELDKVLEPLGSSMHITRLRLSGESPEQRRREERDERDRLARGRPAGASPFPEMAEFAAAQRTVQIMGQVLRSYPGSLGAAQKLQILEESYSLGLRAAGAIINLLVREHHEIAEEVAHVLVKQRPELAKDIQKVRSEVRDFLGYICQGLYYGAVLHVSDSVGLPALRKTYEKLLKKDHRTAYKLVDVAIRLDHFEAFPDSEIASVARDLAAQGSEWGVLRRLVWRHLYLFPVEYRRRQQLCTDFRIHATPLLLNAQGHEKRLESVKNQDSPRKRKRKKKRH